MACYGYFTGKMVDETVNGMGIHYFQQAHL